MKAYKYICISILTLICTSCFDNLLDPLPKDRLAEDLFWKTQQDATYALNGIYSVLGISDPNSTNPSPNHWRYCMMDSYTDIAHIILQWRAESAIEKNVIDASNNVAADDWKYYYIIISTANTFLDKIDQVDMDGALKNRYKAEAKTLRAFAYINLVMLYGDVPLVTTTLSLEEAKSISRSPAVTVWNTISQDLSEAANDLPNTQSERGRVTKGVALGLKAKAMLYAGNYQEAKTAAKAVMDLGVHTIYESYPNLFMYAGENSSEIMFARQHAQNLRAHEIFRFLTANSLYSQQCQSVPTKPLVDAYEMKTTGLPIDDPNSGYDFKNPYKDRDPRLGYTIYVDGDILPNGRVLQVMPGNGTGDDITSSAENVTTTGWYFKKWVNPADYAVPNNCGVNLIYLRYADVLLIYAEACIESGSIDQSALDAINAVRGRPGVEMPLVTTTDQAALRSIVRRERMVELAMEGHRLYDIRRWRIGEQVIPGTVKGMTYEDPARPGVYVMAEMLGYVKEFNPARHYLWPVPFREININPNLTQNPGY